MDISSNEINEFAELLHNEKNNFALQLKEDEELKRKLERVIMVFNAIKLEGFNKNGTQIITTGNQ